MAIWARDDFIELSSSPAVSAVSARRCTIPTNALVPPLLAKDHALFSTKSLCQPKAHDRPTTELRRGAWRRPMPESQMSELPHSFPWLSRAGQVGGLY